VTLVPFCKLADPASYQACDWDLSQDLDGRTHWCDFFKRHFDTILKLGLEAAVARGSSQHDAVACARGAKAELVTVFDDFLHHPEKFGRVTMLDIDTWRDEILRKWGFPDAFIDLKNRENQAMLPALPTICAQIDALNGEDQFRAVIEGVFAGNIFDMGADATAKAFLSGSPDFFIRSAASPSSFATAFSTAFSGNGIAGTSGGGTAGSAWGTTPVRGVRPGRLPRPSTTPRSGGRCARSSRPGRR